MSKKKSITIPLIGWLARSKLMGYELFPEKPELREEKGDLQWRMLGDFTTGNRGIYAHLGGSHVPMSSSLYLAVGKTRRVKLELIMSTRTQKRVDEVETTKLEDSVEPSEEKVTIGKMTRKQ